MRNFSVTIKKIASVLIRPGRWFESIMAHSHFCEFLALSALHVMKTTGTGFDAK